MTTLDLLRLAMATFWIAYVITSTDGPFNVFKTLRARLPLGGLTACIICLSIWVSFALLFLPDIIVNGFAIAGGALVVYAWSGWRYPTA